MVIHSKHIPQRMCISCRRSDAKQNLTRMVLTPQGTVEIDHTGKKAGRGAYLCFDRTCWGKIINNKKLESTFKRKLSSMDYRVLLEYINNTDDGVPEREIK
ncbi:MAG: YlxR family protein [Dehalococcoidia bacterium]|nr:YlxR family protein [Dehalococcoidia bacterium]MDZ4245725.1 YlxR family protein [Dehalococcoidia bacterium]